MIDLIVRVPIASQKGLINQPAVAASLRNLRAAFVDLDNMAGTSTATGKRLMLAAMVGDPATIAGVFAIHGLAWEVVAAKEDVDTLQPATKELAGLGQVQVTEKVRQAQWLVIPDEATVLSHLDDDPQTGLPPVAVDWPAMHRWAGRLPWPVVV